MWGARKTRIRADTISDILKDLGCHTIQSGFCLEDKKGILNNLTGGWRDHICILHNLFLLLYCQYAWWCIAMSFFLLLLCVVLELVQLLFYHVCGTGDNWRKTSELQFPLTGVILNEHIGTLSVLLLLCVSILRFECFLLTTFLFPASPVADFVTQAPSLLTSVAFLFLLSVEMKTSHLQ